MAKRGHALWTENQKNVARIVRELKTLCKYRAEPQSILEDIADKEAQLAALTEVCDGAAHSNPYADQDSCPHCKGDPAPKGRVTRRPASVSEPDVRVHVEEEPPSTQDNPPNGIPAQPPAKGRKGRAA